MFKADKARIISDREAAQLYRKELREFLRTIRSAAKRGQGETIVFNVRDDVKEKLESLGYVVTYIGMDYDYYGDRAAVFKISWE